MSDKQQLATAREHALALEKVVNNVVIGQQQAIRLILIALHARGHVLLEGGVGVGKTTLLRAFSKALGGAFGRIEGSVDLMPNDLLYSAWVNADGKPVIEPGPLIAKGEETAVFFFNEINRARPQVHSLLLRVMAERTLTAFNKEHHFPHMLVFADRNQVEKEETFDIPSAARDRFMMEIPIVVPSDPAIREELMFNPKFHDVDALVGTVEADVLEFNKLNAFARVIQNSVDASPTLRRYALDLWTATKSPEAFGVKVSGVEMHRLIISGASPRGVSMLLSAARVNAWLNDRVAVIPEDIHAVFHETIAHRLVFSPVYEMRRTEIARELLSGIVNAVSAP